MIICCPTPSVLPSLGSIFPARVSAIVSASIRFTSPADSGTETLSTSPSYTLRLRAPPLRPSAAARSGSACSEQKALPLRTGAAHGRPAFVFAWHLPFAVGCRSSGMGDTSSLSDPLGPPLRDKWLIVADGVEGKEYDGIMAGTPRSGER